MLREFPGQAVVHLFFLFYGLFFFLHRNSEIRAEYKTTGLRGSNLSHRLSAIKYTI